MFLMGSVARRAAKLRRVRLPSACLAPEPFCFLLEQPEDPAVVLDSPRDEKGRPYSSMWRWLPWLEWSKQEGVTTLSTDQGPLGHPRRKPTTLGILGPGWTLQPVRGPGRDANQAPHPTRGYTSMSGDWAAWAPGLKSAIVDFVSFQASVPCKAPSHAFMDSSSSDEANCCWDAPIQHKAKALGRDEAQRQAWAQHLAQDHLPRRRDCYHCLAGEFQQKAHHRVSTPQAYCLGVDLLGPLVLGEHESLASNMVW